MLPFVNRTAAGAFIRVAVFALAAVLLCGPLSFSAIARDEDRKPYIVPGDGDGVGGLMDYDLTSTPTTKSDQQATRPAKQGGGCLTTVFRFRDAVMFVQFYLIVRK
jgi:hypothetical protein